LGELLSLLALVAFSANIITAKVASGRLDVQFGFLIAVLVNVIFSALLLASQFAFFRQEPFYWSTKGLLLFALTGFFSTYVGRWLFYDSVVRLGPAKASSFQVSNPLFTVLIAWVIFDEDLTAVGVLAIAVILLGLFLVSYVPRAFSGRSELGAARVVHVWPVFTAFVRSGAFLALSGALAYAIGNVLRGAAIREWNEPIMGALIGATVGAALHLALNSNARHLIDRVTRADRAGLLLFIGCGVLTICGQIFVIASMHYIAVSIANLITMSTPVLVTPLSYFLLKNEEGITFRVVSGIVLVLAGITAILLV
jgi:drug/metabolite transporter (DMT)-like permease